MAAIPVLYGEPSWLRIIPGVMEVVDNVVTTKILDLGTKADYTKAIKVAPTHVGAALSTAKDKYHTTEGSNGNQYSVPDNSQNYNVITGDAIAEDTNTQSTGKMDCSIFVTPAQRSDLITWHENGVAVFGIREIGKNSETGLPAGYEYIAGIITDLKDNPQKGPSTIDFSITGKVIGAGGTFTIKETTPPTPDVVYTDFNAEATGAGNTITPHSDGDARTITAIISGDWTRMLLGKIVTKLV